MKRKLTRTSITSKAQIDHFFKGTPITKNDVKKIKKESNLMLKAIRDGNYIDITDKAL